MCSVRQVLSDFNDLYLQKYAEKQCYQMSACCCFIVHSSLNISMTMRTVQTGGLRANG